MAVSASRPLPASPITSTPPTRPSRYPSSSRASCSSSTSTARRSIVSYGHENTKTRKRKEESHRLILRDSAAPSGRHPLGNRQFRNFDRGRGATAGHARELELIVRAVNRAQPFVHVAEADAFTQHLFQAILAHPEPIVVDLDDGVAVAQHASDRNPSFADLFRQAVLD